MGDDNLPKSGFLYSPRHWPGREPWAPEPGRCRASVHSRGGGFHTHQCNRKAKVNRLVMLNSGASEMIEYCATHDPIRVANNKAKREAKWRAEWDEKKRVAAENDRKVRLAAGAIHAIKLIALGHNDPRALALTVLADNEEPLSLPTNPKGNMRYG